MVDDISKDFGDNLNVYRGKILVEIDDLSQELGCLKYDEDYSSLKIITEND